MAGKLISKEMIEEFLNTLFARDDISEYETLSALKDFEWAVRKFMAEDAIFLMNHTIEEWEKKLGTENQ